MLNVRHASLLDILRFILSLGKLSAPCSSLSPHNSYIIPHILHLTSQNHTSYPSPLTLAIMTIGLKTTLSQSDREQSRPPVLGSTEYDVFVCRITYN